MASRIGEVGHALQAAPFPVATSRSRESPTARSFDVRRADYRSLVEGSAERS